MMVEHQAQVYAIDDDPVILKLLLAALAGHTVRCFASGEEFFASADRSPVGCVVVDLNLPGISGVDIQDRLRQEQSDLTVIVVSGGANVAVAVQVMQNGALTLLEKPYSLETLRAAVEQGIVRSQEAFHRRKQVRMGRDRLAELSADERQVLDLMVTGASNKFMAQKLVLGMRTVERHRSNVLRKMGVDSVAELAILVMSLN